MNQPAMNYQQYAKDSNISLREADPVQCCLRGKSGIFNAETCPENPLRRDIWLCPAFMSQRCAENWDGYCDIYLTEKQSQDATGKAAREFIRDTADARFCRVDSSIPGSGMCATRCEMFNPTAPVSAQVCKTEGDIVYRDSSDLWNLDTNYNWSGKLSTASPIKMSGCKKVCDNNYAITDADRVINECLDSGVCQDIMQNLAQNIVSNGAVDKVSNKRLRQYIDAYILSNKDGNVTPKVSSLGASPNLTTTPYAMPAVNPYIAPQNTYTVADIGNFANTPVLNVASNLSAQPVKADEAFRFMRKRQIQPVESTSVIKTAAKVLITFALIALLLHVFGVVDLSTLNHLSNMFKF